MRISNHSAAPHLEVDVVLVRHERTYVRRVVVCEISPLQTWSETRRCLANECVESTNVVVQLGGYSGEILV